MGKEEEERGFKVCVLYSTRDLGPGREILFLDRLRDIMGGLGEGGGGELEVFLTGGGGGEDTSSSSSISQPELQPRTPSAHVTYRHRRIVESDIHRALGPIEDRAGTAVYVCGPPGMTEEVVGIARSAEGMDGDGRCVFSERWW